MNGSMGLLPGHVHVPVDELTSSPFCAIFHSFFSSIFPILLSCCYWTLGRCRRVVQIFQKCTKHFVKQEPVCVPTRLALLLCICTCNIRGHVCCGIEPATQPASLTYAFIHPTRQPPAWPGSGSVCVCVFRSLLINS